MQKNDDILPACRQCPSGDFELSYINKSRFMAICHARECVLHPSFPDLPPKDSQFMSKSNVQFAVFTPLENCPHIEKLREEGKIPWATEIINFLNE